MFSSDNFRSYSDIWFRLSRHHSRTYGSNVIYFHFFLPGSHATVWGTSLFQDTCLIKQRKHNIREDCYISEREMQRIASKSLLQLERMSHNNCYKLADIS